MTDYTKTTNFAAKDNLVSGNPAKVVKGSEIDTEYNNIAIAVATKSNIASPTFTGTVTIPTVDINAGNIDGTVIGASSAAAGTFTSLTTSSNVTVGGNLTVTGNAVINGNLTFGDAATDTVAFGADVNSHFIPDIDDTYDLGSSTQEWRNLYIDGTANIDSLVADTVDINGGTLDGVVIGGASAAAATFTTATATTGNITTVNATTVDSTNVEVTNLKAKDGTASATIADVTGVITVASAVLTTADINGGTADAVVIGGATPAAGTFTSLNATGGGALTGTWSNLGSVTTVDINGGTIDGAVIGGSSAAAGTFTDLTSNSSATLKHSGSTKLYTLSDGVGITGTMYSDLMQVNGTAIIEATSASAALRITQIGSGNALLVEDSSNPDSTPFVVTATGSVGIGTTSPAEELHIYAASGGATLKIESNLSNAYDSSKIQLLGGNLSTSEILLGDAAVSDVGKIIYRHDGNSLAFNVNSAERLRISSGGDISFYEDTGTTAKFFWDASAESLGIGTTSPSSSHALDVIGDIRIANSTPRLQMVDTDTSDTWYIDGGSNNLIFQNNANERLRIDSSGNVGIGTSSPVSLGAGYKNLDIRHTTGGGITLGDTSNIHGYLFSDSNGLTLQAPGARTLEFMTGSTERLRIDSSGNLLVGRTSTFTFSTNTTDGVVLSPSRIDVSAASLCRISQVRDATGTYDRFYNGANIVGSITCTTSATAYNTSSDQRLKENITDADDAGSKIDAIQVRQFDWKADGSHQDYGMIAQELVTVAPEAVSQPEDPEEMMGVDYSKLVPMLVKEIQSLRARVAQLEGGQ